MSEFDRGYAEAYSAYGVVDEHIAAVAAAIKDVQAIDNRSEFQNGMLRGLIEIVAKLQLQRLLDTNL